MRFMGFSMVRGIKARPTRLADDDTDQSERLQRIIDTTPDGATIFLPSGRYRLDRMITVTDRVGLTITGHPGNPPAFYTDLTGLEVGYVDGNGRSNRKSWQINRSTNCRLANIAIEGSYTARDEDDDRFSKYWETYTFEHAVSIFLSSGIVVEDVTFQDVGGDGIHIGSTGNPSTDITIRRVTGTHCGRQSFGITNVDGCIVEDCNIQWGGRSGLDIEPNHDTNFVRNFTMRRTTIGSKFYPFIVGGNWGDPNPHVSDIVIEDCVGINAASAHPAILANSYKVNLTVRRHTDTRCRSKTCLQVGNTTGTVLIEDCQVTSGPSTDPSFGIQISDSPADFTITGNTFQGVSGTPPWGADDLYVVIGTEPLSITHYGNVWQAPVAENDGPPP